jgi:AcrR family transcriptional regulator
VTPGPEQGSDAGSTSGKARRGRPRDAAADGAILGATLAILAEEGYPGLSMDAVAARAGVSKSTIYRRWASKQEVVLAAAEAVSQSVPVPDTGSVRGDLEAIADGLVAVFNGPSTARLVGSLVAEATRDDALADALRSGFLTARRQAARVALERGIERGEIQPGTDTQLAVDQLAAPFYYRLLLTGGPIDQRFAYAVVDGVLRVHATAGGLSLD